MVPVSDKRSRSHYPGGGGGGGGGAASPPSGHLHKESGGSSHRSVHSRGHSTHSNAHSHLKENTVSTGKHGKKGLEILDFHESWLEEVELYKDKLFVQKSIKYQQQQLLHAYSQRSNNSAGSNPALSSGSGNAGAGAGIGSSEQHHHLSAAHSGAPNGSKSRVGHGSASATPSIAAVSAAAAAIAPSVDSKQTNGHGSGKNNAQLLLKRARLEGGISAAVSTPSTTIANGKQSSTNTTSKRQPSSVASTPPSIPTKGQNSAKSGSSAPTTSSHPHTPITSSAICSPLGKPAPAKVIVNQFHASSLLANSHQEEEKSKILALNGLTKTAASAYEACSIYACSYFSDNRNNAKGADGVERTNHHMDRPSEDPGAAIDDVNDFTETDSDEEYIGQPFFLEDDGDDTQQSRYIRFKAELPSPATSEAESDATEDACEYYTPKSILSPSLFPNVPPYLNFSSHAQKGPSMPAALHKVLKWKLSPVMPKIVKRVVLNSGFRIIKNTTDWMAIWEKHMKSPGFRTIRSHQKYNHMPGSFRIGRKDSMWRSIHNNMKKFGQKEFGFMQKSYIMPDDLESLRQVWPKNASKLTKWIVKPPASARGTGIRIVNKWSQFPKDRPLVVQKYIERPLLINDNKFDMRIYVVVTSINPLRIYMYKDGLARFASVKYSAELNSLDDRCMHLTNYSINKYSQNYSRNEDFNACQGHKWTLQSLWSCLEERGVNTKRLWATLRNLVIKAIISGESGLNRMYRQNVNFRYNCFELFGFDVLLDEHLIPWLLEINISPSLHSELPLDLHVKGPLIQAVLNTALYQVPPKLTEKQQTDILDELKLEGPLCHDKRLFTTCLTAEEVRKHNQYTNRSIEFREEYIDTILDNLLPDDVRCLIVAEDEYARSKPLERIFPTPDTFQYLKFIDNPRYYNRLLDAWESKYGHCRDLGITMLSRYCQDGYHQHVSEAALEKEPNVSITEIDMLHQKKTEDPILSTAFIGLSSTATNAHGSPNDGDSANASKASSPESMSSVTSAAVVAPIPNFL